MLIIPSHSFFTVACAPHWMVRTKLATDRVRSCGKYLCVGHRFQTLVERLVKTKCLIATEFVTDQFVLVQIPQLRCDELDRRVFQAGGQGVELRLLPMLDLIPEAGTGLVVDNQSVFRSNEYQGVQLHSKPRSIPFHDTPVSVEAPLPLHADLAILKELLQALQLVLEPLRFDGEWTSAVNEGFALRMDARTAIIGMLSLTRGVTGAQAQGSCR